MDDNTIFKQLNYDSKVRKEVHRYLTYQFLHQDEEHLWSNIAFIALSGIPLEVIKPGLRGKLK